jgi:hypothetical protein
MKLPHLIFRPNIFCTMKSNPDSKIAMPKPIAANICMFSRVGVIGDGDSVGFSLELRQPLAKSFHEKAGDQIKPFNFLLMCHVK